MQATIDRFLPDSPACHATILQALSETCRRNSLYSHYRWGDHLSPTRHEQSRRRPEDFSVCPDDPAPDAAWWV